MIAMLRPDVLKEPGLLFISTSRNFFIISSNSLKVMTPSLLMSTSLMISSNICSFPNFFPTPSTFLISAADIDPSPSLSNNLNASLSLASYRIEYLLIVATCHSE